ncbi:putative Polysaccharide chain length determinant protein [Candidatus Methylobacter favarea]|uniref:Putative Polysaccharide chain length determinant protein n=1 Tax=Candidatus Methylobacter favarea TaxID=2707345 RepID=A0A8S0WXZ7_9GAMM|nr:XrtA system polysaccharide chain length determinant [Candidatus Methylobacter favarea]CAA9889373.1 putative Polysaccharide chain length determinant protein [Candidatus Methylobacter favarea]
MQDQISEILYYLKGTLKYKWMAIIIAWIVCLSGWIFVAAMPNKYASEAKVHVETRTMLQPLLQEMTIQSDVRGLLRVMQLLMFTQNNLEQIIKLSDLEKDVKNAPERQALMASLKKDIKINGGASDIFTIQYEAKNPDIAKNVVQAVLTVFSEQTHKSTLSGADVAQRFIDEQIQEYETRLKNAEKARENFKRANFGLLPGEGDQISKVQGVANLLEDAKLQLNEALSRRQVLSDQLNEIKESNEDWGITGSIENLTEADTRIQGLTEKKKQLLLRFTEKHPEIVSINKTIADLQKSKQKAEKEDITKDMFAKPEVMANPYIQTIKVALNEAEATVGSSQARVEELKHRLDRIGDEMNSRLAIETELQNLNRDYDSLKRNHQKLIASREQATMSEKVDNQAEALKFQIADAPDKPLKPSSPNRELLFSAVLVIGILLGLAMAFLLYFIRPTIMSTLQLRQLTGLPVLGNVSMKINALQAQKDKIELIRYGVAALGLVMIYISFMAAEVMEVKFFNLNG